MKRYGLVGFPLSHSFSKGFFAAKFQSEGRADCSYENYELADLSSLKEVLVHTPELIGLNVTIPYKEKILPYLDEIDSVASEVGAVNTLLIHRDLGSIKLRGYNTDVWGFEQSLLSRLQTHHRHALILGTGGASKAVEWVLNRLQINFLRVSRTAGEKSIGYNELEHDIATKHLLWINTSPVGMYPNTEQAPPLPYEFLGAQHLLFDLIYNPAETLFLRHGRNAGAQCKNGLEMLELQAEKAWEIWNKEAQ